MNLVDKVLFLCELMLEEQPSKEFQANVEAKYVVRQ